MSDGAECICNASTSKMGEESPEAPETVSLVNVTIKKRERDHVLNKMERED